MRAKLKNNFYPGIFFNYGKSFGFEGAYIGDVLNGRFLLTIDNDKNWMLDSLFEKWFLNKFSFKTGISFGSKDYRLFLFYFSYLHLDQFLLEYNFYFPFSGIKESFGIHIIRFNFYFKKVKKEEIKIVSIEKPNYYLEAKFYFEEGNLLKGWEIAKKGLVDNPDNYNLKELSIEIREKLVEKASKLMEKGEKFLGKGDYLKAFDFYDKAVKVFPDYKKAEELRRILKNVIKFFEKVENPHLRKAINFYIEGKKRDSLLILTYLSQKPKNKNIKKFKKFVEREMGFSFEEGGIDLIESKLVKALNYIYEGRYDKAIFECKDVLVIDEKNVLALKRMGSSLFALGRKDEAERYWRKALEINPEDKEIKEFLSISKKKPESVLDLKKIYMEGLSFLAKKDFKKAKEKFKIITQNKLAPVDLRKKAEEKLEEAEKLEQEKINLMKLHFGYGLHYYKNGDYKKAIKEFKKVLELEPEHPQSKRLIEKCKLKLKE